MYKADVCAHFSGGKKTEVKNDVSECLIKPSVKQIGARQKSGRSYNREAKQKSNSMLVRRQCRRPQRANELIPGNCDVAENVDSDAWK